MSNRNRKQSGSMDFSPITEIDEEDFEVVTNADEDVVADIPEVSEEVEEAEDDESEPVTTNIDVIGVVSGCQSLNVRNQPKLGSEVVSILHLGSDVIIDEEQSTDDFYKVCTPAGGEGYCMRQYITIR